MADMTRCVACYRQCIAGQEAGIGDLETASTNAASGLATDADTRGAVDRCMAGYQDYVDCRRALRDGGAPAFFFFFSPPWCTAFENSVLWLGGCRPTLAIRLLYSLCGEGLEAQVDEFLVSGGQVSNGGMGMGVTAAQLALVNDLHRRTLRREDELSDRLATLQEDIADRPLLPVVRERAAVATTARLVGRPGTGSASYNDSVVGEAAGSSVAPDEVDAAMESYRTGLARLLVEADELRMATARALVTEILTPRQALEMLLAAKQLHLSVRDWSRRREGGGGYQYHQPQQLAPCAVTMASSSAVRPRPVP